MWFPAPAFGGTAPTSPFVKLQKDFSKGVFGQDLDFPVDEEIPRGVWVTHPHFGRGRIQLARKVDTFGYTGPEYLVEFQGDPFRGVFKQDEITIDKKSPAYALRGRTRGDIINKINTYAQRTRRSQKSRSRTRTRSRKRRNVRHPRNR